MCICNLPGNHLNYITDNASLLEYLFYFYLCDYENLLIR